MSATERAEMKSDPMAETRLRVDKSIPVVFLITMSDVSVAILEFFPDRSTMKLNIDKAFEINPYVVGSQ